MTRIISGTNLKKKKPINKYLINIMNVTGVRHKNHLTFSTTLPMPTPSSKFMIATLPRNHWPDIKAQNWMRKSHSWKEVHNLRAQYQISKENHHKVLCARPGCSRYHRMKASMNWSIASLPVTVLSYNRKSCSGHLGYARLYKLMHTVSCCWITPLKTHFIAPGKKRAAEVGKGT